MRFSLVISWLTLLVISTSCKQDRVESSRLVLPGRMNRNYYDHSAQHQVSDTPTFATKYFYRKQLVGDFNGDDCTDTLYESLMSRITGQFIDSVVYKDFYDPYGYLVDTLCSYDPVLKLKARSFNDIKLNQGCQIFGVLVWQNIGNINSTPGDEIALVKDHADFSGMNSCQVYSYCGNQWQEVFWYDIMEYQLYWDDNGPDISGILKKRNSEWYWLDADFIDGGEVWRTFRDCECSSGTNN